MTTTEPMCIRVADTTPGHDPVFLICDALGVPRQDWRLFMRWANDVSSPKALDELHAYVDVMIADRCRRPTNDLMSMLI